MRHGLLTRRRIAVHEGGIHPTARASPRRRTFSRRHVMRITLALTLLAALVLSGRPAAASDAIGEPNCCARCGCHVCCSQKTCQLVCGVKKETRTSWSVQCQEFCPLLPGCYAHRCDECQPPPRCGRPKCVKTLVKHEYEVEVPVYKCVVLYLCPRCVNHETPENSAEPTSAPPTPTQAPPPK
jgi:hypothetical protein